MGEGALKYECDGQVVIDRRCLCKGSDDPNKRRAAPQVLLIEVEAPPVDPRQDDIGFDVASLESRHRLNKFDQLTQEGIEALGGEAPVARGSGHIGA